MKVSLAQINYIIGDFEGNTLKMLTAIEQAKSEGSSLIVFSELSVCGYPPLDLLEHKWFIEKCEQAVQKIAEACIGIAAIIGSPLINNKSSGKNLYNAAFFCFGGKIQKTVRKSLLPTYDVFDEYRYFEPGKYFDIIIYQGYRLAVTICEDLWFEQPINSNFGKNKLYSLNPLDELAKQNPDLVINIAASPFDYNHDNVKREILMQNASRYKLPILYVNQVGAHTEIIFDGGSRIINSLGTITHRLPFFNEAIETFNIENILSSKVTENLIPVPGRIEKIYNALILGISDYFKKTNIKSAVVGLSGGIDSAVTLVLAVKALGADNVSALLMPSQYSSEHSVTDARELAETLQIKYDIIPIRDIFNSFENELSVAFSGTQPGLTEENIQARIRCILLMAISNKFGNMLLNTSNKSEAAVGYGTLYGDMAGGLSVLGDVYKTDVYLLAKYINSDKVIIPENTIIKPPSAELRPDQKDSDSLPEYDILDKVLYNFIELRKSPEEIIADGFPDDIVRKTVRMVNNNEFKRYQAPPILRISSKAFGDGRRMPLVARYF